MSVKKAKTNPFGDIFQAPNVRWRSECGTPRRQLPRNATGRKLHVVDFRLRHNLSCDDAPRAGWSGSFTFKRFQNTHLSHPLFISGMTRGGGAASRIVCQECSTDTNKASGFLEMGGGSLDEGFWISNDFTLSPPSLRVAVDNSCLRKRMGCEDLQCLV
ncbi:hypothetical protein CEXT_87391 [Caerostris extrusa]|uniref:Uncharacterized protein n=1 Tax=Caerostris extrusa TaxID=172846 RepID=A0AAV4QPJ0_CAEEX|nr:hypothetical protein CEXT_87391 [Caerostris extrusa]